MKLNRQEIINAEKAIGLYDYNLNGPDRDRETYYGDYSLVGSVSTNEAGITNKNSEKPMISTRGLGPCIAIAGYIPKDKTAFLSHNVPLKKLDDLNDKIFDELEKRKIKRDNIEFYLIGGNKEYKSHLNQIKKYLNNRLNNPKIVYEDLIETDDPKGFGKSFIIDSRNGKFYSQNSINIPKKTSFLIR
ncbi:MAG TPA: hypothetical protein VJ912_00550 [Candidatus Nanoarchaeia archaeon]|nr:hypothetical protein [Candidatus Nanoarchaeia archaeon]